MIRALIVSVQAQLAQLRSNEHVAKSLAYTATANVVSLEAANVALDFLLAFA